MFILQDPEILYDVYMSYHEEDVAKVEEIKTVMLNDKKDLRIFSEKQLLVEDSVWQKAMHEVMKQCKR